MFKDPVVPLSPSLLPQQRLYEVKTLPQWPSGVQPVVGYPDELGVPDLPKRRSRHTVCLCQAEWAWTPHHDRLGAYYVARGRRLGIAVSNVLRICSANQPVSLSSSLTPADGPFGGLDVP